MSTRVRSSATWFAWLLLLSAVVGVLAQAPAPASVLDRDRAGTLMPATVFFRGQSAPIQARNSAGLKFGDGKLMLAAIVDTSGYSSGVQEKYQAYLITEVPLLFAGHRLAPGAYGFGFVGDQVVVMDLGANDLFRTPTAHDAALKRPTPLEILPDAATSGAFRLYLGRAYVMLAAGGA